MYVIQLVGSKCLKSLKIRIHLPRFQEQSNSCTPYSRVIKSQYLVSGRTLYVQVCVWNTQMLMIGTILKFLKI